MTNEEAFEKWFCGDDYRETLLEKDKNGNYKYQSAYFAYKAWSAAIAYMQERGKLVDKTDNGAATLRPIDIEKLAVDCEVSDGMFLLSKEQKDNLQKFAESYAAKVLEDKEREIAELKTTVRSDNSKVIAALNANINDLRETLKHLVEGNVPEYDIANYKKLLAKTPAQSLIEHDNDVIERCAKVVESMIEYKSVIDAIRALKGKQNEP